MLNKLEVMKRSEIEEPTDYVIYWAAWVLLLPMTITECSKSKNIRRFGIILTLPWLVTWVVTGIPMLLLIIITSFVTLMKDA